MKPIGVLRIGVALSMLLSLIAAYSAAPVQAQQGVQAMEIAASPGEPLNYTISNYRAHINLRNAPEVRGYSPTTFPSESLEPLSLPEQSAGVRQPEVQQSPEVITLGFFPSDVRSGGGHVLPSATSHSIFVNCPSQTCWGSPIPNAFLNNLSNSTFIHLVDQYVVSAANNRYPASSTVVTFTYPVFGALATSDILQIVHNSAKLIGAVGYAHIYHVFLPKGTDVCMTGSSACYSPDNPPTFAFCGFHSSVTFSDIGHVLFSVEPFQLVAGCDTPNLKLTDSTAKTLSHEMFETITDPDVGSGFIARFTQPVFGQEIGDLCVGQIFSFPIGPTTYQTQLEYSDGFHGCANGS